MKFVVFTHVPHLYEANQYFAYGPYVREMNIWEKYIDQIILVAPLVERKRTAIESAYSHPKITLVGISDFDVLSILAVLKTFLKFPKLSWIILKAMRQADHIHLRCPGNVGLLACVLQVFFPFKQKTAKYAGNWDPKSKQPWSYRLQKWILSNAFLTRNMQVLVYGQWEGSSKNINSFFTASYNEVDKIPLVQKGLKYKIGFLFVGALAKGKNPLYAIQLVQLLQEKGYNVYLDLYGEGVERTRLEEYIEVNKLESSIVLKGNQSKEMIQKAYQQSHFVVLPSASEGWPKAIAEGMFWGCVPVATAVSCVPFMLDQGNRGILLEMELEKDVLQMEAILYDQLIFDTLQEKASRWSRKYTVDLFEAEIKKLLQS
jgi:glycosyltransferase involved in cell wall biosynthesis